MSSIPEDVARGLNKIYGDIGSMVNRLALIKAYIDRTISHILYVAPSQALTPRESERIKAARDLLRFSGARAVREVEAAVGLLRETMESIGSTLRGEDHKSLIRARLRALEAASRLGSARRALAEADHIRTRAFPRIAAPMSMQSLIRDIEEIEKRLVGDIAGRLRSYIIELRL